MIYYASNDNNKNFYRGWKERFIFIRPPGSLEWVERKRNSDFEAVSHDDFESLGCQ